MLVEQDSDLDVLRQMMELTPRVLDQLPELPDTGSARAIVFRRFLAERARPWIDIGGEG
jgi:hypothetical protein